MRTLILSAALALSALAGLSAVAQADYFGSTRQAQEGQHLDGLFGQIEKGGI